MVRGNVQVEASAFRRNVVPSVKEEKAGHVEAGLVVGR